MLDIFGKTMGYTAPLETFCKNKGDVLGKIMGYIGQKVWDILAKTMGNIGETMGYTGPLDIF